MSQANPLAPSSPISDIIRTAPGVKITDVQKRLLEEAYTTYTPSTVRRKLTIGKSGAEVYLIERNDQRLEIAKFDHPYGLHPELKAYNELVTKTSPEYRVELRGKVVQRPDGRFDVALIESADGKLGVLIYNFLGRGIDSADNSLLEYYKSNGSAETCKVLEHLFDAYGPQWWDAYTEKTVWYGEEYDRLLPVHLTLKRLRAIDTEAYLLQSGQLEWGKIRSLKVGDIVHLKAFEITECRDNLLRLRGLSPPAERSTDLRLKVDGLDPDQYQPGEILKEVYAEVTATRTELLAQEAAQSHVHFSSDGAYFSLHGLRYANPLRGVDALLSSEKAAKSSIIHGDLTLRNIMVHKETGFAWLIDFAHTRSGGPTLFDLQRLEEHVIAEMLAPLLEKRKNGNDLVKVLNALHSDPLNPKAPRAEWQPAYTVLHKIRELAKPYLTRKGGWSEYYRGLFLVFMGALKYNRTPYQRDLLFVGAATVQALMDKKVNEPYLPRKEHPMQKWLLGIAGILLLGCGIGVGVASNEWLRSGLTTLGLMTPTVTPRQDAATLATEPQQMIAAAVAATMTAQPTMTAIPTMPPTAPATPAATHTPVPTIALQDLQPPQKGTILARVLARGYLICGIAGDIFLFSNKEDANGADTIDVEKTNWPWLDAEKVAAIKAKLYDEATGFDTDFCRALAVAIFGEYEGRVAFLNLAVKLDPDTQADAPIFERFDTVEQGIVDVAFRNTTWTMARALRVAFGPVTYYDSLKFMVSAIPGGTPVPQDAADAIAQLGQHEDKICVLDGTTTIETLKRLFGAERIVSIDEEKSTEQKKVLLQTNDELVALYLTDQCKIIASDESQLISQKAQNSKLKDAQIIPVNQGIAFEPLAPFVAQGDSQWLNILTHVVWNTMYAEQVGISQNDVEMATRPNGDANIPAILRQLDESNAELTETDYKALLGIQGDRKNEALDPVLGIRSDYVLQIISQLGNYGEIFKRNLTDKLEQDFPRKFNCVWNPLKQPINSDRELPSDECRLVVPPL